MPLTTINITGTFNGADGSALSGQVVFTPSVTVYSSGVPVLQPDAPITAEIVNGSLKSASGGTLSLVCTDNSGLTFEGLSGFFFYNVQATVAGVVMDPWYFSLPHTLGASVDLFSLANTAAGSGGGGFANPMTTLGDLIDGGTSGTPARLAGNTSGTREFLTSQGSGGSATAPAWTALQAGDIPQLADYAPTGLTGATAASRYVGATASDAPASGTFAAGDYVIDQSGKIWICTIAGSPGTWTQAGTSLPLTTLGDTLYEGSSGLARLPGNTTATRNFLRQAGTGSASAAPAWDTLQAADLPAVLTTFTFGASGAAPASGIWAAGATAIDQNGVLRVCTVSGSPGTWMRAGQQPWEFYVDDYGAKGDGVQTTVTVSTSSAQVTAAAPVFTSTAVDGGKNIMICGAGGAIPGGPLIDTIASVQSPTVATLTSGAPAGPSGSGLAAVFSSDDRVAIDHCQSAATAYALAHNYFAKVIYGGRIYGLGSVMFQSAAGVSGATLTYNTQVRLPVPADQTGESGKLEVQQIGAGAGGQCQFWTSVGLNMPGTALVSYSVGPNSAGDPTYGQQSVMGGPSAGSGTISADSGFFNAKAVVKGITFVQPGWSNSIGLDCQWIAAVNWDGLTSTAFAPSSTVGGGVNPYSQWIFQSFWQNNKIDAGFRLPNQTNNDELICNSLNVQGLNLGILSGCDHVIINRLAVNSLNVTLKLNPAANAHAVTIAQASVENVNNFIVTGGSGAHVECDINFDGENTTIVTDVHDAGNQLYGVLKWSDQFRSPAAPTISGAANLKVINNMLSPGHWSSPPAVPATTVAQQNTAWRDATVYITSGGAAVSAIAVDSTTTGLTLGTSGTVAVRVPSGHSITLTYASTAPTWTWVLD